MTTSGTELREPSALNARIDDEGLTVELSDGRTIAVPLVWFPRLIHASRAERENWRFIGGGSGIHWPALDEDISIESLLAGRRSAETPESLHRWLESRKV